MKACLKPVFFVLLRNQKQTEKHPCFNVHFIFSSGDPVSTKKPTPFLEFVLQATYVPGTDPVDELLYQVTTSILDEEKSEQNIATLWPDQPSVKSLYEATQQFLDED